MIRDLMENDHAEVDRLFSEALGALEAGGHEAALHRLDLFWARLAVHIRAEHLHLFPALSQPAEAAAFGSRAPAVSNLSDVLGLLRRDHNEFMAELARSMKMLRSLLVDDSGKTHLMETVRSSLTKVRSQLEQHNRIEEESIYSLQELLSGNDEAGQLEENILNELRNLPARFASPQSPF